MESPPKMSHDSFTFRFPARLWRIINSCSTGAISWGASGKTICIMRKKFEEEYLLGETKPFKTRKYESFVRQLNHYGFKKVKKRSTAKKATSNVTHQETTEAVSILSEYHNPNFVRGQPERVTFLERRSQLHNHGSAPIKKRTKRAQILRQPEEKQHLATSETPSGSKLGKERYVQGSHTFFSQSADGDERSGNCLPSLGAHSTETLAYSGPKTMNGSSQQGQSEYSMLSRRLEHLYQHPFALEPVSPAHSHIPRDVAMVNSSRSAAHLSEHILLHDKLYNGSAPSCPMEAQFQYEHAAMPSSQCPSVPLHPQLPRRDDFIQNHTHHEGNHLCPSLSSRRLLGSGIRAGSDVIPMACREHSYHPAFAPFQHTWGAGYQQGHRPMSDLYENQFRSKYTLDRQLPRYSYTNPINMCQHERPSRLCPYLPYPEPFSPVSHCPLRGWTPTYSQPLKLPPVVPSCSCSVCETDESLSTIVEKHNDATGHNGYSYLNHMATPAIPSDIRAPVYSKASEIWTTGLNKDIGGETPGPPTVTPDGRTCHTAESALSNRNSSQEHSCRLEKIPASKSQEEVLQDYAAGMISGDTLELPLDVVEETVVTCNSLSGTPVVPNSSVEQTVLLDPVSSCTSTGFGKPFNQHPDGSNDTCFHDSRGDQAFCQSKKHDRADLNRSETQVAGGLWAYSPSQDKNKHQTISPVHMDSAHFAPFTAYQQEANSQPIAGNTTTRMGENNQQWVYFQQQSANT